MEDGEKKVRETFLMYSVPQYSTLLLFYQLFCCRNFPTKVNIEKKGQILQEKIARGEVVEEKFFG